MTRTTQGHRSSGWLIAVAFLANACAAPVSSAPDDRVTDLAEEEPLIAHPTAGYFEHARSPIVPFCHGVLIAPDVVVTAANCASDGWFELSFGIGEPGDGQMIAVVDSYEHPRSLEDHGHALIALVLEHAVPGITPADTVPMDEMPCDVEVPSYAFATRGSPAPRSMWKACGDEEPGVLLAMDGYPSCHGESGAGAFVAGDAGRDRVIGWVTAAGHLGTPNPIDDFCVSSVGLATVADNRDFLIDARTWSRIPAPF